LLIANDIKQLNDVRTTIEVLENFDFSANLLLLDWFEDFDDAFLLIDDIDALEDFAVLSTTNLANNFIVILLTAREITR
jgi:hypothetical protein